MALIPTNVKLEAGNGTLSIRWSDGHQSVYEYQYLRDRCPCATCLGTEGQHAQPAPVTPLPMFKSALKPERAEVVGRYALQIHWNDSHSAGIYTFPYLRNLCPCQHCTVRREAQSG
jgi:DUF971 family protein